MKQQIKAVSAKRLYLILMGILLVTLFMVHFTRPVRDGDIYFHLTYGQHHVENRTAIMDHSVFSWTPATKYYPYCTWASDILFNALYMFGGWPLLFGFKYLCILLTAITVWLYAKQTGMGRNVLTPFILIIVLLSVYTASILKPDILSLLFFVLIAYIYFYVKAGPADNRKRYIFLLYPLVFLLWANMHNVVFFGLMLLAVIISGEIINYYTKCKSAFAGKDLAALVISGILSAAGTLINPYGINLHRHFLGLLTSGVDSTMLNTFTAYQPMMDLLTYADVPHRLQYWGIMGAFLAILFLAYAIKRRIWDFGLLLPNLFLGLLALQINRTGFYWAAFWAMSLFYLSGRDRLGLPFIMRNSKPLVKYSLLLVLLVCSTFFSLRAFHKAYYEPKRWSYFGIGQGYLVPVQESAFLKKYKIGNKHFISWV